MDTLFKVVIVFSIILVSSGEPLSCNDGSSIAVDGIHCECRDGSMFNAHEGKCQGVCDFYGNTLCSFYFDHSACEQNPSNATDYECWCAPGYELDMDNDICIDADECNENGTLSCPEFENEVCYNLEGKDVCDCMEYYFRNDEYNCQEMDLCNMPDNLTSCEQVCIFDGNYSFFCSCNEGFKNDSDTMCTIDTDNGYSECECQTNPEYGVCAEADGSSTCYPLPGYQFASDDITLEDINECEDMTYQCPLGSICVNDIGGYHCDCLNGYFQVDEDFVLNGCQPMDCEDGMILDQGDCVDPCEVQDVICPEMSVCLTDENNVPTCSCQVECQSSGLSNSSTFSIYSVELYLPYEDASEFELTKKKCLLTKSMESIFGKGNAEIVEDSILDGQTGFEITIKIGVSMPLEDISVIGKAILEHCWELEQDDSQPQCILPGGLILNEYSIVVKEINRCEDSTLCEDVSYSMCVDSDVHSGRYWCTCIEGFENVEEFYCEDINECITGDDDCEDGMICVNGLGNYSCEIDNAGLSTLHYLIDETNREIISEDTRVAELYDDLDEQTQTTKTVGGVIGGIFGAIFVVLVIAIVYVFRIKSKKEKLSAEERRKASI